MTEPESGLELFDGVEPGRIGIVNLVLAALANGPRETTPTLRFLLMHSGISGGYIHPSKCLELAFKLELIRESPPETIALSSLGQNLLAKANWPPYYVLSPIQGRILLQEVAQDTSFRGAAARLLRKMTRRPDGSRELIPGARRLRRDETQCLLALQALHVANYSNGAVVLPHAHYVTLAILLGPSAAVSEDELLQQLDQQRRRGLLAEQYAERIEIARLRSGGRSDLAELVERVSAHDVAAGYDIRSFGLDGSYRYIEVKSSTGEAVRFFISRNELEFLRENESAAWIYFVPSAHRLPFQACRILAIPSPVLWIDAVARVEEQDYLIEFPRGIVDMAETSDGVAWLSRRSRA